MVTWPQKRAWLRSPLPSTERSAACALRQRCSRLQRVSSSSLDGGGAGFFPCSSAHTSAQRQKMIVCPIRQEEPGENGETMERKQTTTSAIGQSPQPPAGRRCSQSRRIRRPGRPASWAPPSSRPCGSGRRWERAAPAACLATATTHASTMH